MLLSPCNADCIIVDIDALVKTMPAHDGGPEGSEEAAKTPLFTKRWDKLPVPCGVFALCSRNEARDALITLGWNDFPAEHVATEEDGAAADARGIERLCGALRTREPLFIGSSDACRTAMDAWQSGHPGHGAFIAVGAALTGAQIHFSSAADALRAIMGVV